MYIVANSAYQNQISNQIDRVSDEESENEIGRTYYIERYIYKKRETCDSHYYAWSHAESYRSSYTQSVKEKVSCYIYLTLAL